MSMPMPMSRTGNWDEKEEKERKYKKFKRNCERTSKMAL